MTRRLGVLISGRGSNLHAIASAIAAGRLRAEIGIVISNRDDAAGVAWARSAGLETRVISHREFPSRDTYDAALVTALHDARADLVCLAGFMRVLGTAFCTAFPQRILNIHPSLLPAFPGMDAQRQAIDAGAKITGATVHFVTADLDAGPIVAQVAVPIHDDDTTDTLAARVLIEEHRIYPDAIGRILDGRWRIDGRRVVFA